MHPFAGEQVVRLRDVADSRHARSRQRAAFAQPPAVHRIDDGGLPIAAAFQRFHSVPDELSRVVAEAAGPRRLV